MRISLFNRLFGYYRMSCESEDRAAVLSLLLAERIPITVCSSDEWILPCAYHKRLLRLLDGTAYRVSLGTLAGVPGYLYRYRRRVGLLLGGVLAAAVVALGASVVWRVEVSGNERLSSAAVCTALKELGLDVGTRKGSVEVTDLANQLRLAHQEIAWVGIYFEGGVAHVKIKESLLPDVENKNAHPANLVASEDAVIREICAEHGSVKVKVGDVVRKGELLIGGIVEGAHTSSLLCASGSVIGEVTRELCVEIPYVTQKNSVKNKEISKITLNFFGNPINISLNTGNSPSSYGTIIRERQWRAPNGSALPISLGIHYTLTTINEEIRLNESEAMAYALALMNQRILEEVGEGELIGKRLSLEATENGCTVRSSIVYTRDITKSLPIMIE